MKIKTIMYILMAIAMSYFYSQWYTGYTAEVQAWEPVVAECSSVGGFMDAEGHCVVGDN